MNEFYTVDEAWRRYETLQHQFHEKYKNIRIHRRSTLKVEYPSWRMSEHDNIMSLVMSFNEPMIKDYYH